MMELVKVRPSGVRSLHTPTAQADTAALLASEAQTWATFARTHGRMREATVAAKALDSVQFSLGERMAHLAVPSKLSGTSACRDELLMMDGIAAPRGIPLQAEIDTDGSITVSALGSRLGLVQGKHVQWIRPLIGYGLVIRLLTVTGTEEQGHTPGCNVCFCGTALAVDALEQGTPYPALLTGERDVFLWRDEHGTARSNVRAPRRWSPTGIDWGRRGHGPADLACAILARVVPESEAERLCARYVDDVVSMLPEQGCRISAISVLAWLQRHG